MPQQVAIFGATSAIAADVARLYTKRGAQLYLVARSEDKLERLVAELGSAVVGSAAQDFDRTERAEHCVATAIATLGHIDIAIIAHGVLGDQLESEASVETAEQIARTNYLSAVALIIPLANHFERRGYGHLAVMSSVAAERGRPRNYTYAAAKSALNTYLEGVRSRLYAKGVKVHILKLGPVDTPMTVDHPKNLLFSRAPEVARQIVRAIDRDVFEAYVPGYWRPVMFAVRHLPEFVFQRVRGLSAR
ncbi:MAG: oxidoreductase, short-chain dehydrogenase/reductase family [Myxococcaceae bacterium]|nr:oxidoreductase, short-chain dehydrogenase/reductase family [Myxococcaceae bacterium]